MTVTTLDTASHLLSPAQVADVLGVSRRSVYRNARAIDLPFFRLTDAPNAPLRCDPSDLREWIVARKSATVESR